MAQAMALIECTWRTTRCRRTACIAVSMDGRSSCFRAQRDVIWASFWIDALTSAKSSGTSISSCIAWDNHLPDALIQRIPSSFMEVFPLLACTSRGSLPTRAERSRREEISLSARMDKSLVWSEFFTNEYLLVPDWRTILLLPAISVVHLGLDTSLETSPGSGQS